MVPAVPVSVVIVDHHPVVRAGLSTWCAAAEGPIEVVAEGPDVSVALYGPGRAADVVVLELLPRDGRPTCAELHELVAQQRRIVGYTMRGGPEPALARMDLGSTAVITRAAEQWHLVTAIRAAAAGVRYTPPRQASGRRCPPDRPLLSARELEVLVSWFRSESKGVVAKSLGISERTVNTYLDRVRIKYANAGRPASTKAKLMARAVQDGLISLDEL
ncbi:response regulator transcription factor [Streptomyces sp. NRRL F-5123]|uniref:response regulator transcription factor n=1 Tax=Streptomyces sp. NRRL F-5123 TaxID=1463856 RepID=UPI0004E275D1|nr:response regulator transcription factor [Streptomyces sp. NRRL F-5123]